MKCPECKRNFSSHLLQPLIMGGSSFTVCPICALRLRNEHLGIPINTPFQGEIAVDLYNEALQELRKEPKDE